MACIAMLKIVRRLDRDGGIRMAFERPPGIAAQRVAVKGAMKVVYWLCKEEVAHTTKYESLIDLVISLGCTYVEECQSKLQK
jgi:hypothetical protein